MSGSSVVILGLGWVGEPLALTLSESGVPVTGTIRTVAIKEALSARLPNVQLQPWLLGQPIPTQIDDHSTVVITMPPHKVGPEYGARMIELAAQLKLHQPRHVIYLSSTSVYGDALGQCTEATEPKPATAQAQTLLATERMFQQAGFTCVTILRLAGLIGPKRYPGRFLSNQTLSGGGRAVNLVHLNDVVSLLCQLIAEPKAGVFNVVAPDHPSRAAFYQQACRLAGLPLPKILDDQDDGRAVSGALLASTYNYSYQIDDLMAWLVTAAGDV